MLPKLSKGLLLSLAGTVCDTHGTTLAPLNWGFMLSGSGLLGYRAKRADQAVYRAWGGHPRVCKQGHCLGTYQVLKEIV
eukprot:5903219-Pyramimonas_sp.AAC.1